MRKIAPHCCSHSTERASTVSFCCNDNNTPLFLALSLLFLSRSFPGSLSLHRSPACCISLYPSASLLSFPLWCTEGATSADQPVSENTNNLILTKVILVHLGFNNIDVVQPSSVKLPSTPSHVTLRKVHSISKSNKHLANGIVILYCT